ncbi:MAG: TGS domain-containing protein [Prevotellaceae bacterium]|jgi:GTP pyrophosphokinase|nr:TGS domain-containing protein [Prevotellaceae bacterium]
MNRIVLKLLRTTRRFIEKDDLNEIRRLIALIAPPSSSERGDVAGASSSSPLGELEEGAVNEMLAVMLILVDEMGQGRKALLSYVLYNAVNAGVIKEEKIVHQYGEKVDSIVQGLLRAQSLYEKHQQIESENFRKLFLALADDLRVVLILTAKKLYVMRNFKQFDFGEKAEAVAREAFYFYAAIAHKLGLYAIKSELEDLALKYASPDIYHEIARKLNETKRDRDRYIADFIAPIKEKLTKDGFDFDLKGRTKSIFSIYNKMRKSKVGFENIYDLFAIRIIVDCPPEKEKAECWRVYSEITDMYQPNPKRLRDWLSIPKSNGYESLHTTVMGPQGKWVEVQIRSRRMDEIAEKGLAAHWKYKGVKSDKGTDQWLNDIREMLENPDINGADVLDDFKLSLYEKEIFVFTPNGDLHKLRHGATVLDFAFHIHTGLGVKCAGARIDGRNVPIRHVLHNGDQVEIITAAAQKPKRDWLNIVVTSKAKAKIRQALKETEKRDVEAGRDILQRRFKNWKIELDDAKLSRFIKKRGYKSESSFFQDIALEKLDVLQMRDLYLDFEEEKTPENTRQIGSFSKEETHDISSAGSKEDVLVIEKDLKNIDYTIAKCCNPIYGDPIFGFMSATGGFKIHRDNCPNAPQMKARFGYRILPARWAGKAADMRYPITLRISGKDDASIMSHITSVISKEKNVAMRSISADANDGIFHGSLTVMLGDLEELQSLIKKIAAIKGVNSVERG